MSCDILVLCQSKERQYRDDLAGFLSRWYLPHHRYKNSELVTEGYRKIGFRYSVALLGWERETIYAVTRWIAINFGEKKILRDFKRYGKVPYYLYDNIEPTPLVVVQEPQKFEESEVTPVNFLGMSFYPEHYKELALQETLTCNKQTLEQWHELLAAKDSVLPTDPLEKHMAHLNLAWEFEPFHAVVVDQIARLRETLEELEHRKKLEGR